MVSPSVPSCKDVPVCPTVRIRNPGHLATCQVVQVDRLVLATLDPFVRLMSYGGAYPCQPATSTYQRAGIDPSGLMPFCPLC